VNVIAKESSGVLWWTKSAWRPRRRRQAIEKIVSPCVFIAMHLAREGPWTDSGTDERCTLPEVRAVPCHGFSDCGSTGRNCNAGDSRAGVAATEGDEMRPSFASPETRKSSLPNVRCGGFLRPDADRNLARNHAVDDLRPMHPGTKPSIVSVVRDENLSGGAVKWGRCAGVREPKD